MDRTTRSWPIEAPDAIVLFSSFLLSPFFFDFFSRFVLFSLPASTACVIFLLGIFCCRPLLSPSLFPFSLYSFPLSNCTDDSKLNTVHYEFIDDESDANH
ncbi:hypothetical protein OUZ56_005531 [Daphnia magna]|uniref:Transmembrane protein n=1 Tax=Daphnia magna TaxID=35525 RepID=A0ABQ9YT16_9CRUS|nr:hypothetical protein OUZ56_005531 [Daphnia magna]